MISSKVTHPILFFSVILFFTLQTENVFGQKKFENSIINYGFKIGLNALSTTDYEVYNNDVLLHAGSYKNKNGFLANGFFRINLDRFFMQPEIEWNQYRQEVFFALPIDLEAGTYESSQGMEIDNKTFNIYVLTGYHIIRNGPYIVNLYLGGSFKSYFRTAYDLHNVEKFVEHNYNYNFSGLFGISMNIGIIHFDARYQINFPNTDLSLSSISGFSERFNGIVLKKNENILSFSCGIMF